MSMASQIKAGSAFIEITTNDSKAIKGLNNLKSRMQAIGASISAAGRGLLEFSAPAALPVAMAVKTYASFDDQMRLTQAVTKATGKDFDDLTLKAKALGRSTSFTAVEVASAMTALGRMGFSPDEIQKAIAATLNLSRATGTELAESADIAANSLRIFGLDASRMSSTSDILTAAANGSAQTLTDLFEALKMAGPQAKAAKETLGDTAAAIGVLANMGIKGSLAGTALRKSYSQMANPKIQSFLKNFGISVTTVNGDLRKMADILTDVAIVMQNMPTAEKISFAEDIFDIRGSLAGLSLTGNISQLQDFIQKLREVDGTAADTAANMDRGIGGAGRIMYSAIEGVAIALGESLGPSLIDCATRIENVSNAMRGFIENHQTSTTVIAGSVAGLAALGVALVGIGAGMKVFALGAAGVAGLTTAITALSAAVSGGLAAAVSGIAGAIGATSVAGVGAFAAIAAAVATVSGGIGYLIGKIEVVNEILARSLLGWGSIFDVFGTNKEFRKQAQLDFSLKQVNKRNAERRGKPSGKADRTPAATGGPKVPVQPLPDYDSGLPNLPFDDKTKSKLAEMEATLLGPGKEKKIFNIQNTLAEYREQMQTAIDAEKAKGIYADYRIVFNLEAKINDAEMNAYEQIDKILDDLQNRQNSQLRSPFENELDEIKKLNEEYQKNIRLAIQAEQAKGAGKNPERIAALEKELGQADANGKKLIEQANARHAIRLNDRQREFNRFDENANEKEEDRELKARMQNATPQEIARLLAPLIAEAEQEAYRSRLNHEAKLTDYKQTQNDITENNLNQAVEERSKAESRLDKLRGQLASAEAATAKSYNKKDTFSSFFAAAFQGISRARNTKLEKTSEASLRELKGINSKLGKNNGVTGLAFAD